MKIEIPSHKTDLLYVSHVYNNNFFIYLYPSSRSMQKEKKKKIIFKHATLGKNHYKVFLDVFSFVMNENKFLIIVFQI